MYRTNIQKGLEPTIIMLQFICNKCEHVWTKEKKVGGNEVINGRLLKCPECNSTAVSLIYPKFQL